MTSIEWLIEEIEPYATSKFRDTFKQIIHLAKEMHKQEIILFAEEYDEYVFRGGSATMEEYYQETFVSKGSDDHISDISKMVELPQTKLSDGVIPPNSFILSLNREEPIIIIDEEGFKYKSELIKDSGEIYKLFKEFLQTSLLPQQEISDEEIEKAANGHFEGDLMWSERIAFKLAIRWYREQLKQL